MTFATEGTLVWLGQYILICENLRIDTITSTPKFHYDLHISKILLTAQSVSFLFYDVIHQGVIK